MALLVLIPKKRIILQRWISIQHIIFAEPMILSSFSSEGTNYFVELDFNPAHDICRTYGSSCFSSEGTSYFVELDFNPAHDICRTYGSFFF